MTVAELALRAVQAEDLPFLQQVFVSTRAPEFALLNWSVAQLAALLEQQFNAQHTQYQARHPDADFLIITLAGQPAGRLYVDRTSAALLLLDIALLPEFRGAGIGSLLLRRLLDEAAEAAKPVRLHVVSSNRARRFYERHGFTTLDDNGMYCSMEWRPEPAAGVAEHQERLVLQ